MNKRLGLAALTIGIGTLASASAFAQTVQYTQSVQYAQPVVVPQAYGQVVVQPAPAQQHPGYVRPGFQGGRRMGQHPQVFAAEIRARMNDIEREVRQDVNRGRAHPNAIHAVAQERNRVELQIAAAASDGVIMPFERRNVTVMVDAMERIDDQYRIRTWRGGMRAQYGR